MEQNHTKNNLLISVCIQIITLLHNDVTPYIAVNNKHVINCRIPCKKLIDGIGRIKIPLLYLSL